MLRQYEVMYIVNPQLDEETMTSVLGKVEETVKRIGGSVDRNDRQGRKRLAYPLGKFNDGFYVLTHFSADPDQIHEVERTLRLTENVLRHLVVRKEG